MFAAVNDGWRENEEVLDQYMAWDEGESSACTAIYTQAKRHRETPSYSNMKWDEIDPALAAKLRFRGIYNWARDHEVRWASCLEQLLPCYEPPLRDPPPSALSTVRTASWLEVERVHELRGTLFRTEPPAGGHKSVLCGLNGVPKMPKNVLRVIFDARRANELYAPRPEKLILFTLEALVHGTAVYRYITTVDYRHFFYQFPLPERLAWLFVVRAGGQRFWPRVLPMGWREAVCIAQVASWMIVLHYDEKEVGLEERYGLRAEDVARTFALPDMPAFFSLRRGDTEVGRIFVLLDGVLVACSDAALRDRWAARLRRNEDNFHAVRKECHTADLGNKNHTAEFAGVVFTSEGWRPRAALNPSCGSEHTAPTRQVAGRLGSLLWAIRVRGALDPARRGLLQYPGLLALYRRLGCAQAWKWEDTITLSEQESALLAAHERALQADNVTPWALARAPPKAVEIIPLATDAYPNGMGLVQFNLSGEVVWSCHEPTPATLQVEAECNAVPWALRRVADREEALRGRRPRCFLVAVDADTVRAAFNKGYARKEPMQEALRHAFAEADWLLLVRVPGKLNGADAPSRNGPLVPEFVRATWEVLRHYLANHA